MSELRNLRWGEKHLCGVYYSIKVSISPELYELMIKDLVETPGISVTKGQPSKVKMVPKYIVYGIVNQDQFLEYLQTKEKAQATLLINKATLLLKSVKNRSSHVKPKPKPDEKIEKMVHSDVFEDHRLPF